MKKSRKNEKKYRFWIIKLFVLIFCVALCALVFVGDDGKEQKPFQPEYSQEIVGTSKPDIVDNIEHPIAKPEFVDFIEKPDDENNVLERQYQFVKALENMTKNTEEYFVGYSKDGVIALEWNVPAQEADLTIVDSNNSGASIYTEQVKGSGTYLFREGVHGTKYSFELWYTNNDGNKEHKRIRRVFVNFDSLPNMTTLYIDTQDGKDPSYDEAPKLRPNLFGQTITNNNYKDAVLNNDVPLKIRVRGNNSAYGDKKPYKLLFAEKVDLLDLGQEYADKEWVLLSTSLLETYFGFQMGNIVGMEWEPRMRFVNLIMNGSWRGPYILCESIKRHPKRVAIEEDGFLIESDAYYWKSTNPVIEGKLLSNKVKFTFKYPKIASISDQRFSEIEEQIIAIEDAAQRNSKNIGDLIDLDTFASWLLSHELMATKDCYGTNKFFYRSNMNPENKLKMGPLWDFDAVFNSGYSGRNRRHSEFFHCPSTYFPLLLKNSVFRSYYKDKYFAISPYIEHNMKSALEELKSIPGLEESMKMDIIPRKRFGSLENVIDDLINRLHYRIEWLNEEISKL